MWFLWLGLVGAETIYDWKMREKLKKKNPALVDAIDTARILMNSVFFAQGVKNIGKIIFNSKRIRDEIKKAKTLKDKAKIFGKMIGISGMEAIGVGGTVMQINHIIEQQVKDERERFKELLKINQIADSFLDLSLDLDELDEFIQELEEWNALEEEIEREEIEARIEEEERARVMQMEILAQLYSELARGELARGEEIGR